MPTSSNFELATLTANLPAEHTLSSRLEHDPSDDTGSHSSLPPTDGGRDAWTLLATAFVFEALLWGFPLSFGVFQNYYSQLPQFQDDPYIAVVGTAASGITYIAAPIVIPFIRKYGAYRHRMVWIGWPLCLLGLVAGSFANTLAELILTQGVMYGVGFTIFYYPILSMLNEWWITKKGMAAGIMCSASGVSGAVMPFCTEALLQRYGYPTTLRATAVGLFVLTGPLISFLKGRTIDAGTVSRTDWSFLRSPRFWVYNISNFAMGLGYFFPSLYLPSYATSNGLSATQGALLLSLMSMSQVMGQLTFGYLSDGKVPLDLLAISSPLIAGAAAYSCWGVAHSFGVMTLFALLYGFFGSGFTALWIRMGTTIASEPTGAFAAFGCLNLGKGVGSLVAGPIGGVLLKDVVHIHSYGAVKYELVVLFTGSCLMISSVTVALRYLKIWGL